MASKTKGQFVSSGFITNWNFEMLPAMHYTSLSACWKVLSEILSLGRLLLCSRQIVKRKLHIHMHALCYMETESAIPVNSTFCFVDITFIIF